MNPKSLEILEKFAPKTYIQQACQAKITHENEIRILLEKCKIPKQSWSSERIELLLNNLSMMDSNNSTDVCGLGEREGRVFSTLVSKRNYGFSHGIGRSGDITELQPKAIGSSILNKLTNELILDYIKLSGISLIKNCFLVPMATGMSLTFCMLSIRLTKPNAKYVLMPRIDQKSCIKSVITAGFTPVIIENLLIGDELQTDLDLLEKKINELNINDIACIFSTASCFAPRGSDKVEEISVLCKKYEIFHLINNAYGLQSSKICHMINQSGRVGRVDIVIQSTDKNLMVPVGGTIISSFDSKIIENISKFYPGRASSSQTLDVLITLLSIGSIKYKEMLADRKENFQYLKTELEKIAEKNNEKVLVTPNNSISLGFSLSNLGKINKEITQIGSMLFTRNVTGVRVVIPGVNKEFMNGILFENFNSHSKCYPCPYLTAAAAIGIKREEIDLFIKRLQKVLDMVKHEKEHHEKNI